MPKKLAGVPDAQLMPRRFYSAASAARVRSHLPTYSTVKRSFRCSFVFLATLFGVSGFVSACRGLRNELVCENWRFGSLAFPFRFAGDIHGSDFNLP